MKKVHDASIVESYLRTGNIWKTGEDVGLSGQTVYERLKKLGIVKKINYWTEQDSEVLLEKYKQYKMLNKLDTLAEELGRTKQFICRKAKELGLTDAKHKVMSLEARMKLSESTKKRIQENGHPKGFLGHKHGENAKKKIAESSRLAWKNPSSGLNSKEFRQKKSDNLHLKKMAGEYNTHSNRGKHKLLINDKEIVFNSSWELEIAKILQTFVENKKILNWGYETEHFEFVDVRFGNRSYCPDFKITLANGENIYIEVKGWQMENSMKRIEMFKERFGNIKFYFIDGNEYKKILSDHNYLWRRCVEIKPIQDYKS